MKKGERSGGGYRLALLFGAVLRERGEGGGGEARGRATRAGAAPPEGIAPVAPQPAVLDGARYRREP